MEFHGKRILGKKYHISSIRLQVSGSKFISCKANISYQVSAKLCLLRKYTLFSYFEGLGLILQGESKKGHAKILWISRLPKSLELILAHFSTALVTQITKMILSQFLDDF